MGGFGGGPRGFGGPPPRRGGFGRRYYGPGCGTGCLGCTIPMLLGALGAAGVIAMVVSAFI
jgi:hypothetical protein